MGRKKVNLRKIQATKDRSVTFLKRRFGLLKKAYELSILCDCQISMTIVDTSKRRCYQYASESMQVTENLFNSCLRTSSDNSSSNNPVLYSYNNSDMEKILSHSGRRGFSLLEREKSLMKAEMTTECLSPPVEELSIESINKHPQPPSEPNALPEQLSERESFVQFLRRLEETQPYSTGIDEEAFPEIPTTEETYGQSDNACSFSDDNLGYSQNFVDMLLDLNTF